MKRLIAALLLIVLFGGMTAQASEFSLKDYSVFTFGERMLVYQGPGEDYYRNGSAAIGITNKARLYGTLDNCLMIGYGYSTDKFRVGWVPIPAPEDDKRTVLSTSDTVGELRFDMVLRTTVDECAATYDPVKVSMRNIEVKKGATVNVLCWYDKWAYCEFKIEKKLAWGFLYADMVSKDPLVKPAAELKATGKERKTVLKSQATKVPGGNYGVFSGPGENYLRADEGGAHIRPTEKCQVLGLEDGWAFVRVMAESGDFYGYMPAVVVPERSRIKDVSFDCVPSVLSSSAELRTAPSEDAELLVNVAKDAEVNFLAWADSAHSYAYVEYKADGLRVRGFVPANAIAD